MDGSDGRREVQEGRERRLATVEWGNTAARAAEGKTQGCPRTAWPESTLGPGKSKDNGPSNALRLQRAGRL